MEKEKRNLSLGGKFDIKTYTMVCILLLIWLVFTFFTSDQFSSFSTSFISAQNLSNLSRQMAVVGVLGIGAVLVIISGGIDLSVGSLLGFCSLIAALMMRRLGLSTPVCVLAALAIGFLAGLIQGGIIAYTDMPPFIVTLGGSMILSGATLGVGKGTTISSLNSDYVQIGQAYLSKTLGMVAVLVALAVYLWFLLKKRRDRLSNHLAAESTLAIFAKWGIMAILLAGVVGIFNTYNGVAVPVVIMLLLTVLFMYIAEKTTFGRKIYAIGGNATAARYAGIHVKRIKMYIYALNGLLAGIAGVLLSARLGAASPSSGANLELDAIAAAIIGGTSMSGGTGRVAGALLGALMMASITNGMSLMNLDSAWQSMVKGVVLILAVGFDVYTKRKAKKSTK